MTGKNLTLVPKVETALLERQPFRLAYPAVGKITAERDGQVQVMDYDYLTQCIYPWMDAAEFEIYYYTGYESGATPAILKELVRLIADHFLVKESTRRAHIIELLQIAKRLP